MAQIKKKPMKIVYASQYHIDTMKGCLRPGDNREVKSAMGISGDDGLQNGFDYSKICWVALTESDLPICAFGVAEKDRDTGVPWFLGTPLVSLYKNEIKDAAPTYIQKMESLYPFLTNRIDSRRETLIEWLEDVGFTVYSHGKEGYDGTHFREFVNQTQEGE